jgi:flagellar basal-body rod protein FlgC
VSLLKIYDIAASGMAAQRFRVQLIAANIANSESTRTAEGGPFRKKDAVFEVVPVGRSSEGAALMGVKVREVRASQEPFPTKYDPGHPDADAQGLVQYPNVDPVEEMVNLTGASRAFEANAAVVRALRAMANSAQDLLRTT